MQNKENSAKEKAKILQNVIKEYLDQIVIHPTLETVEKDFHAIDRLGSVHIILAVSSEEIHKEGSKFDEDYAKSLTYEQYMYIKNTLTNMISSDCEQIKKNELKELGKITWDLCSRKCLLNYLSRELDWVTVSILSASYISSIVLLRSVFELLIGIATRQTGSMTNRISSIWFLSKNDKKKLNKLWGELCEWAHPYGSWVKNTCSVFMAYKPMYHPVLCENCVEKLEQITDLLLVVTIKKFKINKEDLKMKLAKYKVDLSKYPIFMNG